jgi:DNA-binding response OmpR family regulator
VRILLLFDDPITRDVCQDYYQSRGCEVDAPTTYEQAEAMLRFRIYEVVLGDLPRQSEARATVLRLVKMARGGGATMRVLLTAGPASSLNNSDLLILQKPQRLDAILELAEQRADATSSAP